ncbi:hypothetical protein MSBR3_0098 [Methanosarcina barkeri 3]|uniref:DUF3226 domain-containing protein n=1 Tax=Methanosarcina barkeri 3 TaxID=1434107 RepID=A0A0E3SHH4_METBA|nr:hypothetical protein [Methanosarcina barkeri]AKB80676.1 hypothetical protein MSBR3_0098 [Methanosarcina barkeri 3]
MNIIICEGTNDVLFFEEMFNKCPKMNKKIYSMIGRTFNELETKILEDSCFNYYNNEYDLVIFGDSGKPGIHEKLFPDVISDLLGTHQDEIGILLVLDDDGVEYGDLYTKVQKTLGLLATNKRKFQKLPLYCEKDGVFIFQKVGKYGCIKAKLITVPQNIETVVVRTYLKHRNLTNSKKYNFSKKSPHIVMKELAEDFFDKDIAELIRFTASNFAIYDIENEDWAKSLLIYS